MPRAPETRQDLEEVVRLMVDAPDEVSIREVRQGRSSVFELRVAHDDLGTVIGRQGRTARALRALLEARDAHEGVDYGLEILED